MQVFDIFAGIALVAEDLFLFFCLIGCVLLLAWRVGNLFTAKRHRAPELVTWWAFLGWLFAAICLAGVIVAGEAGPLGRFVAQLSTSSAFALLLLGLGLIILQKLVDHWGERRRNARRPPTPKMP